jgi:hypothetical protein
MITLKRPSGYKERMQLAQADRDRYLKTLTDARIISLSAERVKRSLSSLGEVAQTVDERVSQLCPGAAVKFPVPDEGETIAEVYGRAEIQMYNLMISTVSLATALADGNNELNAMTDILTSTLANLSPNEEAASHVRSLVDHINRVSNPKDDLDGDEDEGGLVGSETGSASLEVALRSPSTGNGSLPRGVN